MTDPQNFKPPQPGRQDAVIEGVKAGLSGPMGILAALIKSPLEKRRDEWMQAVGQALLEFEQKVDGFSVAALAENELFISTIVQATVAAQRTHLQEKRAALRNAILNTALRHDLDDNKIEILIGLIESLSVWHIRILDLFANPSEWASRNNKVFPEGWYMGGKDQVLEFAYPALAGKRNFYDPIVRDLHTKGLLSVESLHTTMSRGSMIQPAIAEWGADLVRLIREPLA